MASTLISISPTNMPSLKKEVFSSPSFLYNFCVFNKHAHFTQQLVRQACKDGLKHSIKACFSFFTQLFSLECYTRMFLFLFLNEWYYPGVLCTNAFSKWPYWMSLTALIAFKSKYSIAGIETTEAQLGFKQYYFFIKTSIKDRKPFFYIYIVKKTVIWSLVYLMEKLTTYSQRSRNFETNGTISIRLYFHST